MEYTQMTNEELRQAYNQRIKLIEQDYAIAAMELFELESMVNDGVVVPADKEAVEQDIVNKRAKLEYDTSRARAVHMLLAGIPDEPTNE